MAYKYNMHTTTSPIFSLPWWHTYDSEIYEISVGGVKNVESNVLNTTVYPDLREFDQQKRYFQKGSDLYLGGINAKLPSPDTDLDFRFSPLPAPVDNTVAQARLINNEVFKPYGTVFQDKKFVDARLEELPTAVRVVQHMSVSALNNNNKDEVQVGSCAASNGALPPPSPQLSQ
jgi:hypothetical protein